MARRIWCWTCMEEAAGNEAVHEGHDTHEWDDSEPFEVDFFSEK